MFPIPVNRTTIHPVFLSPKHKHVFDSYSFPTTSLLTTHCVLSILSSQLTPIHLLPFLYIILKAPHFFLLQTILVPCELLSTRQRKWPSQEAHLIVSLHHLNLFSCLQVKAPWLNMELIRLIKSFRMMPAYLAISFITTPLGNILNYTQFLG